MCQKGKSTVTVIIDTQNASGILGHSLPQTNIGHLTQKLEALQKKLFFLNCSD